MCVCVCVCVFLSKGYSWHDNADCVHPAPPLVLQSRGAAWCEEAPFVPVGGTFDQEERSQHRWALGKGD